MRQLMPLTLGIVSFFATIGTHATNGSEIKPGAWRGQSVTEFAGGENAAMNWRVVNDGVMGGLSQGQLDFADGVMRFRGNLSLENNGGFSSIRTEAVDFNLSNDLGILVLAKGDGRTYQVRLESDAKWNGRTVSFSGDFKTTEGQWQQVKIPFSSFRGSWRGRDLPEHKLDPSQIYRVGIILADKEEGPFDLEMKWIRTYGKGQGNYRDRETSTSSAPNDTSPEGSELSLTDRLRSDERFDTMISALDAAGLTVFFQWDNPLTVFAPTDAAFDNLPEGVLEQLLKPENKETLVTLLAHHVASGSYSFETIIKSGSVDPIRGEPLSFAANDGKVTVQSAIVSDTDITCRDGIIHAVDAVLIPGEVEKWLKSL